MISIEQYRQKIGCFSQKSVSRKFLYKESYYNVGCARVAHPGEISLTVIKIFVKFIVLCTFLTPTTSITPGPTFLGSRPCTEISWVVATCSVTGYFNVREELRPALLQYNLKGNIGGEKKFHTIKTLKIIDPGVYIFFNSPPF